jgi:hypothetical protein
MSLFTTCMLATDYDMSDVPYEAVFDAHMAAHAPRATKGSPEWYDAAQQGQQSEEQEAALRWRPPRNDWEDEPKPSIAFHKLCSNDLWEVTAAECREALEAWATAAADCAAAGCERALPGEPDDCPCDVWLSWIEFLSRAADAEGFLVC